MTSKASLNKYLHQAAFSPPKATLLKALRNNQFATWPGLKAKAVQKYLPDSSPATDKGHMKQQKQGFRSTKNKIMTALETIENMQDMNPPMEKETTNQIFFYNAVLEPKAGKIYVNYTGNFSIRSMEGNTAIFVQYDWYSNAILATPVQNLINKTTVAAFKTNIEYFKKRNFKPVFNIIDIVATKAVKS